MSSSLNVLLSVLLPKAALGGSLPAEPRRSAKTSRPSPAPLIPPVTPVIPPVTTPPQTSVDHATSYRPSVIERLATKASKHRYGVDLAKL